MMPKRIGEIILNTLFPARCVWCDEVIGFGPVCNCIKELKTLRRPVKRYDSALMQEGKDLYIKDCWSCFVYDGVVRSAIIRLKFMGEKEVALPLAQELAMFVEQAGLAEEYDVIIPVPISEKTLRKRGYNQSELLCGDIKMRNLLSVSADILIKVRNTERQVDLSREDRQSNIEDAYEVVNVEAIVGKRVLLVDDVITTGSTIAECAKTLLVAGASMCSAISVAHAEVKTSG